MARLNWGATAERFYETGIDRGVLYTGNGIGVPWNGLTSVSESPTGGEAKPAYIDGYKFRNVASSEEYEATIEAFSAPKEFGPCDGSRSIHNGLIATQQPRQAFNFSYRTLVGNPIEGTDYGYKIHLVYNALAGPAQRSNGTVSDSIEASKLSWSVTTLPPSLTGMKPTAHFIIDTRETPRGLLAAIEDILYGTDVNSARMPLVSELVAMFQSMGPIVARNYIKNPSFRLSSGTVEVRRNYALNPAVRKTAAVSEIRRNYSKNPNFGAGTTNWSNYVGAPTLASVAGAAYSGSAGLRVTTDGTQAVPRVGESFAAGTFAPNDKLLLRARIRLTPGTVGWGASPTPYFILRGAKTAGSGGGEWSAAYNPTALVPDSNGWYDVYFNGTVDPNADGSLTTNLGFSNGTIPTSGAQFDIDNVLLEKTDETRSYFDGGSTATGDGVVYAWTGTANLSASTASAPVLNGNGLAGNGTPYQLTIGGKKWAASMGGTYNYFVATGTVGKFYSAQVRVAGPVGQAFTIASTDNLTGAWLAPYSGVIPAGGEIVVTIASGAANTSANAGALMFGMSGAVATRVCRMTEAIIEEVPATGLTLSAPAYFDGSSASSNGLTYSWSSTVDYSATIATGPSFTSAPFMAYVAQPGVTGWGLAPDNYRVLLKRDVPTSGIILFSSVDPVLFPAGTYAAGRFKIRQAVSVDAVRLRVTLSAYNNLGNHIGFVCDSTFDITTDGEWNDLEVPSLAQTPVGTTTLRWLIYAQTLTAKKGTVLEAKEAQIEAVADTGILPSPYFDGAVPDDAGYFYEWEGAANASSSVIRTWN